MARGDPGEKEEGQTALRCGLVIGLRIVLGSQDVEGYETLSLGAALGDLQREGWSLDSLYSRDVPSGREVVASLSRAWRLGHLSPAGAKANAILTNSGSLQDA